MERGLVETLVTDVPGGAPTGMGMHQRGSGKRRSGDEATLDRMPVLYLTEPLPYEASGLATRPSGFWDALAFPILEAISHLTVGE